MPISVMDYASSLEVPRLG